jgi:hypothetical protein
MWSHLIKLVSLSKGALVVGVAASAAMVSNAEFSNTPSHHEPPSATPSALVAPATPKPTERPSTVGTTAPAASPKTEEKHGDVPQVVKDCVAKYLAVREQGDGAAAADRKGVEEVCKAALAATGLSSGDFWAKFGLETHKTSDKTEPNRSDLEAQIKECVRQYLAGTADASDACRKAIAASGLTPQEFWTKFGPHAEKARGELSADALAMVRECVTKYNAKSADASTTCKRAIELSGLTSAEFAAKFLQRATEPKPAATEVPKTGANTETYALVRRCLELYAGAATSRDTRAVSDACAAAIRASGLSATDFWAKFGKELTTAKPAHTSEPTSSPKPATN